MSPAASWFGCKRCLGIGRFTRQKQRLLPTGNRQKDVKPSKNHNLRPMKTLITVAFVFISVLLMAGPKNRLDSDEIFQFNEETLDAIEKKICEFNNRTQIPNTRSVILVANLLDDSIAYNDLQERVPLDTTYKGSYNPSNILNQNTRKIDIYRFVAMGSHRTNHILLLKGKDMTFINMHKPYDKVIKEVLRYFDRNKEVDNRLMPIYINLITWWYLRNHWADELGPWYDWFQERDSVSREYYKFQYPFK